MTSIKQRMIQFALMLGFVSLGSIDVSNAQFLDSIRPRNTVTADAITRTPVGTRVELTGSAMSEEPNMFFRTAPEERGSGSSGKSGAVEK